MASGAPTTSPPGVSSSTPAGSPLPTFSSTGGTIVAGCSGSDAYLASWQAAVDYRVNWVTPGPAVEAAVTFKAQSAEVDHDAVLHVRSSGWQHFIEVQLRTCRIVCVLGCLNGLYSLKPARHPAARSATRKHWQRVLIPREDTRPAQPRTQRVPGRGRAVEAVSGRRPAVCGRVYAKDEEHRRPRLSKHPTW
jgi:hypothetical protein